MSASLITGIDEEARAGIETSIRVEAADTLKDGRVNGAVSLQTIQLDYIRQIQAYGHRLTGIRGIRLGFHLYGCASRRDWSRRRRIGEGCGRRNRCRCRW